MNYDVVIIGAGGAGMMCAIQASRRGRKVLLLDHAKKLGGKILISGGGRCNFTNLGASPAQYVSENLHFCKSALSRFTPDHFIEMVRNHGIAYHEKKLGQLFCDTSAQEIVSLLKTECELSGVDFKLDCKVTGVQKDPIQVETSAGSIRCQSLVIATGGLSIPKLGASDLGYIVAKKFGIVVTETAPALDGFTFSERYRDLAGISVDCIIECNGVRFRENILFTHTGLSGPAALQASLHWKKGDAIRIDLLPDCLIFDYFLERKKEGSRATVKSLLSNLLPKRLSDLLCELYFPSALPLPQVSEQALRLFCMKLKAWEILPEGTVGYSKAEVTRGGVDTNEISSKTMESRKVPGLYFIGEVLDVTGWLGGYNFQWAWASGWAAGQVV